MRKIGAYGVLIVIIISGLSAYLWDQSRRYTFSFPDDIALPQMENESNTGKRIYPYVILLGGTIDKEDKLVLDPLLVLVNASAQIDRTPGPYTVQMLDSANHIIQEIRFNVAFEIYVEPFGLEQIDEGVFTLDVPLPLNTSVIQITHNDRILGKIRKKE